jgi:putative heme-binding domain-containing protein
MTRYALASVGEDVTSAISVFHSAFRIPHSAFSIALSFRPSYSESVAPTRHPLSEALMRSTILFVAALVTILAAGLARTQDKAPKPPPPPPDIAPGDPKTPAEERKTFSLPPHFEVQLVASEPDIHKPMNMNFDDRGRLWVTESVEYPFAAKGDAKPRDAVKILEDIGPDGKARKITTFADGLNIPIGVLPLPGAKPQDALVYSIPKIYRLRDTEGKGRADRRDAFYGDVGHDDTHGMTNAFTWGFDGWVYACHGFKNTSTIKGSDGQAITMNSGNGYRFRADGTHVEQITHGQVNPFGLTFDPLGNLYSCDCHSRPIYQLIRGGYYPSFSKGNDGLGWAPTTFENYVDSTAIAGIAYYAADHFPKEYRDSCFIGDVVTNRVNQFALNWTGSTPKAELKYWLRSDDQWFRPVDIKLGPDGALYVADFYNKIIGHYEVDLKHPGRDHERGRIWRIVYKGEDGQNALKAPRQDWTAATVDELIKDLAHPNLTVRFTAMNQLVARGGKEATKKLEKLVLEKNANVWQIVHGLWVLQRKGHFDARLEDTDPEKVLFTLWRHPDPVVRIHILRVLGAQKEWTGPWRNEIVDRGGLYDKDPRVQRAAAEAIALHPAMAYKYEASEFGKGEMRVLLILRQEAKPADTHLIYAVRVALREELMQEHAWANLPEKLTDRETRDLADVSLAVPTEKAAAFLLKHIEDGKADRAVLPRFVHHIARHGDEAATRALLKAVRAKTSADLMQQAALFRAIDSGTQERGRTTDAEVKKWAGELADALLSGSKPAEWQTGAELAGLLKTERHQDRLIELATTGKTPDAPRNAALNALAVIDAPKHAAVIGKALADAEAAIGVRENAANLLARANKEETLAELLKVLPTAPARLQNSIAAGLAGSKAGADKLLEAIGAGKASPRLLQEKAVEVKLAQLNVPGMKERIAKLTAGLPAADQKLQELLKKRRDGFLAAKPDEMKGAAVFEKNCANCHQLGGKGAKVGPNLDGIGLRGLERLLEDTLDPNRNVDQAFRTTVLNLKSGQVVSGLLLKEEGEVYVLADAQGKEVRVPKDAVDDKQVSPLSPMPANFGDQIAEKDFYDLLAHLLAQRAGGK